VWKITLKTSLKKRFEIISLKTTGSPVQSGWITGPSALFGLLIRRPSLPEKIPCPVQEKNGKKTNRIMPFLSVYLVEVHEM